MLTLQPSQNEIKQLVGQDSLTMNLGALLSPHILAPGFAMVPPQPSEADEAPAAGADSGWTIGGTDGFADGAETIALAIRPEAAPNGGGFLLPVGGYSRGALPDDGLHPLSGSIVGTNGNDMLYGTESDDIMFDHPATDYGAYDDDIMFGLGGNDTMHAQFGDDTLNGGDGFDDIYGGGGNDTLNADGVLLFILQNVDLTSETVDLIPF